jgi:hypothetical protein
MSSLNLTFDILKKISIVLAIITLIVFSHFSNKALRNKSYNFSANGIVHSIEWKSKNHALPLIVIKIENGYKRFSSTGIILTQDTVKVGDQFQKESKSIFCLINKLKIKCVE